MLETSFFLPCFVFSSPYSIIAVGYEKKKEMITN